MQQVTPAQLEQAYASMRVIRVINRRVLASFNCPADDEFEIDPEPQEPEVTGKPVRRVLSRSAVSHKGWFFCSKTGEILPWESRPELNSLTRLDCTLGAAHIYTQPIAVEVTCPYEHRRRRATVDIYVEINGRPLLLEVKRDFKKIKLADRLFFQLLEYVFWRAGVEYRVWTDDEIREEPAFSNAVWLARYKTVHLNSTDKLDLLRFFENRENAALSEVTHWLEDQQQVRSFAMLMRNWLIAEPEVSVRADPVVRMNPAFVGA